MGAIHSSNNNNRDEKIDFRDIRRAEQMAEKLFALDARPSPEKPLKAASRMTPANRRSILRIFESMQLRGDCEKRGSGRGTSDDGTANSTCNNSPISTRPFPFLSNEREASDGTTVANNSKRLNASVQPNNNLRKSLRRHSLNHSLSMSHIEVDLHSSYHSSPIIHRSDAAISPEHTRSRRIPVQRRRVGPVSESHNPLPDDDDEHPDLYIKQIYDLRTWEMYLRITESRQRRPRWQQAIPALPPSMHRPMIPPAAPLGDVVYTLEPWPQHVGPEHEMIFGDLDE